MCIANTGLRNHVYFEQAGSLIFPGESKKGRVTVSERFCRSYVNRSAQSGATYEVENTRMNVQVQQEVLKVK